MFKDDHISEPGLEPEEGNNYNLVIGLVFLRVCQGFVFNIQKKDKSISSTSTSPRLEKNTENK